MAAAAMQAAPKDAPAGPMHAPAERGRQAFPQKKPGASAGLIKVGDGGVSSRKTPGSWTRIVKAGLTLVRPRKGCVTVGVGTRRRIG